MTDTERERINAICEVAGVTEIDDLSDGFHTFRQLYYQRMMLFAVIVKQNCDRAWKSLRHEDGELCFGGGWFIVGIDTPEGSYTYHYENKYFDLFDCEILDYSKHWDGHTEKDVTRLLSLSLAQPEAPCYLGSPCEYQNPDAEIREERTDKRTETHECDLISRQAAIEAIQNEVEPFAIVEPGTTCVIGAGVKDADVIRTIEQLPPTQPEEAIPVSWIESRIERFKAEDNAFCGLTANIMHVMLNEWKREQEGETT